MAQSKEYWQQYYQKNRERRRQQAKEYYQRTRAERYAKHKEYRKRPEAVAKRREYERSRYANDAKYRERRCVAWKQWYKTHKRDQRGHEAIARARKRAIIAQFKNGKACPCGESDPICLDFHHRDPSTKIENVGRMADKCVSDERLFAEIAKCDLMCANCHRKFHRKERC